MHSYLEACNTIVVWFSNRTGSFDKFVSTSAISYEVQCNIIASGEVERTAVNNLAANIEVLRAGCIQDLFCSVVGAKNCKRKCKQT